VTSEAIARRLEAGMRELISTIQTLGADRLHQLPGEGEWSSMQTLAHVAEMAPFWAERLRDVALGHVSDRAFGRTPEEWAQRSAAVEEHGADALDAMLQRLEASTTRAVEAVRAIPDSAWNLSASIDDGPRLTLTEWADQRLLGHVQIHLRQATDAAEHAVHVD
jgi:uncharacterized damage-inducible protein DinB